MANDAGRDRADPVGRCLLLSAIVLLQNSVARFMNRPGAREGQGAMKKFLAEFIGTLALILIGCSAIVIGGFGGAFPVGILPIALAFGLTVMAMAYGIGPISGCHINPAVTVGMWVAGRIGPGEAVGYIVAQFL